MRASVFLVAFINHFDALGTPQIHARSAIERDLTLPDVDWASAKCGLSEDIMGEEKQHTSRSADREQGPSSEPPAPALTASARARAERANELKAQLNDVAKQAQGVFTLHLTTLAYAAVALAGMRDKNFYGASAGLKLPVVDVEVDPQLFFVVMPIVLLVIEIYLQIHLDQLERLKREWSARLDSPLDTDLLHPWIGNLGAHSRLVHVTFVALAWWATPCLLALYWWRLTVLQPPVYSRAVLSVVVIVGIIGAILWSSVRNKGVVHVRAVVGAALALSAVAVVFLVEYRKFPSYLQRRIDLRGAVLSRPPQQTGMRAQGAHMPGMVFPLADLSSSYLENANLASSDLRCASLIRSTLGGANLDKVSLDGGYLREASLRMAYLDGAHLESANLTWAELHGAWLVNAHLEGADLTHAKLVKASLQGAHLEGADLEHADLRGADLTGAHLEGAILRGACLDSANLTGAVLSGALLAGAHMKEVTLFGANLLPLKAAPSFDGARKADCPTEPLGYPPSAALTRKGGSPNLEQQVAAQVAKNVEMPDKCWSADVRDVGQIPDGPINASCDGCPSEKEDLPSQGSAKRPEGWGTSTK